MKFELYDKVAFKDYKKVDYASSICGNIIAIKGNMVYFSPEKAEYGISLVNTKELKKIKDTCDICFKNTYIKVYVLHDCGCDVYYICNKCLKNKPRLKYLFEKINGIDLSPRAIMDRTVIPEKDFWQNSLENEIKETK